MTPEEYNSPAYTVARIAIEDEKLRYAERQLQFWNGQAVILKSSLARLKLHLDEQVKSASP